MGMIGAESYRFMQELYQNNSKEWFDDNRTRYETVLRDPFKALVAELSGPIMALLPEFEGKPKISRINNDLRFQPNKAPYKEHVWCSFGEGQAVTFFGLSREGWSVGCTVGSKKKSDLAGWRENLMKREQQWNRYIDSLQLIGGVRTHIGSCYDRPLTEGIPDTVYELVQAKDVVFYSLPKTDDSGSLERNILLGMASMIPAYFFMTVEPAKLTVALERLGSDIIPPLPEVEKVWSSIL